MVIYCHIWLSYSRLISIREKLNYCKNIQQINCKIHDSDSLSYFLSSMKHSLLFIAKISIRDSIARNKFSVDILFPLLIINFPLTTNLYTMQIFFSNLTARVAQIYIVEIPVGIFFQILAVTFPCICTRGAFWGLHIFILRLRTGCSFRVKVQVSPSGVYVGSLKQSRRRRQGESHLKI